MNGFLLIDKDSGWTSRDIDNKISSLFKEKRVGHAGTLDPFATGLLIVGLGKATKCLTFFRDDFKEYVATIKLGEKTSSGDLTGETIIKKEIPVLTKKEIENVLISFKGKSKQVPPMTSAIHHDGVKLYKLARQGIEVERNAREIEIYSIQLIEYKNDEITFKAVVSKGTYIRVLGEDIAENLHTVGHLSSLRRISIENINVSSAKKISEINSGDIIGGSKVLSFMSKKTLSDYDVQRIKNGLPTTFKGEDNDRLLLVDKNDEPIAVYKKDKNDLFICERGLW